MSEEGVTYSFKDLFDKFDHSLSDGFKRLDGRLDEINRKIDQKADNSKVAALEAKQAAFEVKTEDRLRPLEISALADEGITTWKDKLGNAVVLLAASSVGAFLYYVASLGGHG